jgi:hypothetical protein
MKKSFKIFLGFMIALVAIFAVASPGGDLVANAVSDNQTEVSTMTITAAVAKNELRERMLIANFRWDENWTGRISNKSNWVNQDAIRLNQMGADPAVLINNNTYPIPVDSRTDASTVISLFKYDTENTVVTDDEIYALPYDKNGSVQQQHRLTLEETIRVHGLHSLAPQANTDNTPILETTGPTIGSRKRLVYADLVKGGTLLDKLKVPRAGRCIVLTSDHKSDLLLEDKGLQNQMHNHSNGMIASNYAGFDLYSDIENPKYAPVATVETKIAYGAATAGREASVVFHAAAASKAMGSVKVYSRDSKIDPENRESVMGARMWAIMIPTRAKGQAAILSAAV